MSGWYWDNQKLHRRFGEAGLLCRMPKAMVKVDSGGGRLTHKENNQLQKQGRNRCTIKLTRFREDRYAQLEESVVLDGEKQVLKTAVCTCE